MNLTTFKTKLLLFLFGSNKEKRNTRIIIIVLAIIVLGVLAIPSFLPQTARARNSEGKSYVGAITRAQQAYRLEHPSFAPTFTDLKIGLPTQTANYIFKITVADEKSTTVEATPLKPDLKSFAGQVVFDARDGGSKAMHCQTTEPSNIPPSVDAVNQYCPQPVEHDELP